QVYVSGLTSLRAKEPEIERATARLVRVVVGSTGRSAPPLMNPMFENITVPPAGLVGFEPAKAHQEGAGLSVHAFDSRFSAWSCGGSCRSGRFPKIRSCATPMPPRSEVLPSPKMSQAKPKRGAKLFLSDFGLRNVSDSPTLLRSAT